MKRPEQPSILSACVISRDASGPAKQIGTDRGCRLGRSFFGLARWSRVNRESSMVSTGAFEGDHRRVEHGEVGLIEHGKHGLM